MSERSAPRPLCRRLDSDQPPEQLAQATVSSADAIAAGRRPTRSARRGLGIIALFFLFLEGKLASALFKWKGGSAKFKTR